MKISYTEPFLKDYRSLPPFTQKAFDKALKFLLQNPRHPSLRAKRLPGTLIFYSRITKSYRFTFQYEDETMILRRAGTHDILNSERRRN